MAEIGDKSKLRRISDILLARSAKMLPSAVNTDEWQPVLSYGIEVDDQSFYSVGDLAFGIGGVPSITRGFGVSDSPSTVTLPGGFIYEVEYLDVSVSFGAAPLNDEKLRIEIEQRFYDLPIPTGFRDVNIVQMAPEDQQPYIRTRAAQSFYVLTYPSSILGTVLPSGLEQLASRTGPRIIIPVPTSGTQPGRSVLIFTISYNAVNGVAKNFPAGTLGSISAFLKRVPVSNFNMDANN